MPPIFPVSLTFPRAAPLQASRLGWRSCWRKPCEFSLHGSNLRAEIEIAADLWKAEVDAGQIEQVVNALMINAREAMPYGGTVRLSAEKCEIEARRETRLLRRAATSKSVSRSRRGDHTEVAAENFRSLFHHESARERPGLSISYSIVKKHGGLLHLGIVFGAMDRPSLFICRRRRQERRSARRRAYASADLTSIGSACW